MSAAALIAPTDAPAIPYAPAGLLPWQRRAIARSGALATERNLYLIGRGVCRVPRHEGAPVYVVSSASRPGASHLVWIERGRIHCDCPARTKGRSLTCSHAQFVRSLIVAEHATRASVPPAARALDPDPVPEPAPVAPAPEPSIAPAVEEPRAPIIPETRRFTGMPTRCPTCRGLADSDEIEQLGECLRCLQMRADYRREDAARAEWEAEQSAKFEEEAQQQLPCWCCGAPATAETSHGLYCDACATKPLAQQRREAGARQKQLAKADQEETARRAIAARAEERAARAAEFAAAADSPIVAAALTRRAETARRVIARDKERTRAGTRSEASPRAGQPMKTAKSAAKRAARATAAN